MGPPLRATLCWAAMASTGYAERRRLGRRVLRLISMLSGWRFSQRPRPLLEHQIYGLHRDGFAGHMHRTPTTSRFYLQVRPGTDAWAWADDAIWSTLEERLAARDQVLVRGPIVERSASGTAQLRDAAHAGWTALSCRRCRPHCHSGRRQGHELGLARCRRTRRRPYRRLSVGRSGPPRRVQLDTPAQRCGEPWNSRIGCSKCCWHTGVGTPAGDFHEGLRLDEAGPPHGGRHLR